MCLHTQNQHEFPPAKLLGCHTKLSQTAISDSKKTSPAELLHADGIPELWKLQGGEGGAA